MALMQVEVCGRFDGGVGRFGLSRSPSYGLGGTALRGLPPGRRLADGCGIEPTGAVLADRVLWSRVLGARIVRGGFLAERRSLPRRRAAAAHSGRGADLSPILGSFFAL
jgi:hypothetical protein